MLGRRAGPTVSMGLTPIQGPRWPVGPRAKASALQLPIPWTKALAQVEPALFSFYIPHTFPISWHPLPKPQSPPALPAQLHQG